MFIATLQNPENAGRLKKAGADALIIPEWAWDQAREWIQKIHEEQALAYLDCSGLYMEEQLPRLKELFEQVKQDIDGIYYSDEGLFMLALEAGLVSRLIYQPETLVTNHLDARFYTDLGIQAVSLAHELSLEEITQLSSQARNLEVLIDGYYPILRSRRKLLRNYFQIMEKPMAKSTYRIQEMSREQSMPIAENEQGTLVYSEKPISSLKQLPALKQAGIERFRLDSIFSDDETMIRRLQLYQKPDLFETDEGYSDHWYDQQSVLHKEDGHGKN